MMQSRRPGTDPPPATAVPEVRAATPPGSDPAAPTFDEVYAVHFQPLTMQLYAYTGDLGLAQDLVQEAFCRALTRWGRVSRYEDPVAWVRRVAWNLASSRWRQLRHHRAWLRRHREEHVAEPSTDHVLLTTALATLPAQHRRAMVMHYLADMPVVTIAQQEGVAEGTVKSWLHRGRAALAAVLGDSTGEVRRVRS
jgi:RNA polymerase sigma-70 factor (ECF subfamily)